MSMYFFLKRCIDLVLGAAFLLLTLPVQCIIASAIIIESGRPIFFRQTRVGVRGAGFAIWKFRTLHRRPHEITDPLSHATRIGRFLRRWGLDELPQLWNVVKGDMSLIGPRPTVPEQVARYSSYERQRLAVRPGITGWAQIHGRNAIDWQKRIDLDIEYIDEANLALDFFILIRTPFSLFSGAGAYGPGGTNPDFAPSHEA